MTEPAGDNANAWSSPSSKLPPAGGAETALLLSYLNAQRRHVTGILEGLDEEALHRSILPSGWTCLGMVQHLALDVERFWFRAIIAGERAVIDDGLMSGLEAWRVGAATPAETVLELYRTEIELANTVITSTSLDAAPAWWPEELMGERWMEDLREAILHVLCETACHAGHLDAAREFIDGRRWLVMTE